jgi:hypothetical protein
MPAVLKKPRTKKCAAVGAATATATSRSKAIKKKRGGAPEESTAAESPVKAPATSPLQLLGRDIGLDKSSDLKEQLEDLREQFVKTMGKQRGHMDKYRALQVLNKQLSDSYFKNLQVIVDVSRLLSGYVEFLEIVKSQTSQIQVDMDKLSPGDFDYIKNLTTEKIYALTDEFMKSASDLKTLYSQYDMKDELAKVEVAEKQLEQTVRLADETFSKLSNGALQFSREPSASQQLENTTRPAPALAAEEPETASGQDDNKKDTKDRNAARTSRDRSRGNSGPSPRDTNSETLPRDRSYAPGKPGIPPPGPPKKDFTKPGQNKFKQSSNSASYAPTRGRPLGPPFKPDAAANNNNSAPAKPVVTYRPKQFAKGAPQAA